MPMTPLHFAVLAPVNHFAARKVSNGAFIFANLLADLPILLHIYMLEVQELGGPVVTGTLHGTPTHTFLGALWLGFLVGIIKPNKIDWWLGAFLGTFTHVLLDMIVHSDVQPFTPFTTGNPFYIEGSHGWLSLLLGIGLVWWVVTLLRQRITDHRIKRIH